MKKQITLIVLSLLSYMSIAQDLIVKNDKTEIKAKIEELTETTIKYKKFEMLDGPSYNINKRDVFMIIYKNGTKEYIESISNNPSSSNNNTNTTTNNKPQTSTTNNSNSEILMGGHSPILFKNKKYELDGEVFTNRSDFQLTFEKYGYSDLVAKQKANVKTEMILLGASAGFIIPVFFVKSYVTKGVFLAGGIIMQVVEKSIEKNNRKAIVAQFNKKATKNLSLRQKLEFKPLLASDKIGNHIGITIGF